MYIMKNTNQYHSMYTFFRCFHPYPLICMMCPFFVTNKNINLTLICELKTDKEFVYFFDKTPKHCILHFP